MLNELYSLTTLFTDKAKPDADRHAAVEFGLILILDPTAATDLVRTLFAGHTVDISNRGSVQRLWQLLIAHGIIEVELAAADQGGTDWRFRARPLVAMLKRMPNRDSRTGLTKTLIQSHGGNPSATTIP